MRRRRGIRVPTSPRVSEAPMLPATATNRSALCPRDADATGQRGHQRYPCTFEGDVTASPGLTTSPSSGTDTTNGETGTIACDGRVNGRQPTGQGTWGLEGRYGTKDPDTCQSGGEGDAVMPITIPTSSGPEHIKNTFTYEYG